MTNAANILQSANSSAVAALKSLAFPAHPLYPRAADLLREGQAPLMERAIAGVCADALDGYVALWPVHLNGPDGSANFTLLGPLMVAPHARGRRFGAALMGSILAAADTLGLAPVFLVGDLAYYSAFGFSNQETQSWELPTVVDQSRVLVRARSCRMPLHGQLLPGFAPPRERQSAA